MGGATAGRTVVGLFPVVTDGAVGSAAVVDQRSEGVMNADAARLGEVDLFAAGMTDGAGAEGGGPVGVEEEGSVGGGGRVSAWMVGVVGELAAVGIVVAAAAAAAAAAVQVAGSLVAAAVEKAAAPEVAAAALVVAAAAVEVVAAEIAVLVVVAVGIAAAAPLEVAPAQIAVLVVVARAAERTWIGQSPPAFGSSLCASRRS